MNTYKHKLLTGAVLLVSAAGWTWAQDAQSAPPPPNQPPAIYQGEPNAPIVYDDRDQAIDQNGQPENGGWRRLGQRGPGPQRNDRQGPLRGPAPGNLPAQLTVPAGTFVTIRVNQALSSDQNHAGEPFSASLVKPIVVDGIVVADRGQTLAGRIAEATKAGRVKGVSRLGIELTEVSLVDGTQIPLRSQLITYEGPGSVGRDATAVGTTAAVGAMIGAVAEGGAAAGIGAGAGAGAALIGVLLTRGHPTVVYPESVLTFRVETPIVINTTHAPQAFRSVGPGDYSQPTDQPRTLVQRQGPPAYYGGYGYPGWYGPGWWGPGYLYGPSIGIGFYRGYGHGYGHHGHH